MKQRLTPCRGCPAMIDWRHTTGGARMPLDPEPVPDGNIVLEPDGRCRVLKKGEAPPDGTPRFQSHWVSCPNRDRFRR